MAQTEQIEIPLSKKKMSLALFCSIVFVILGGLFLINPSMFITPWYNPTITSITGLVSILLFGFCAVSIFRKRSDKKAGLIINKEGIIDNSSVFSAGFILWSDIEEIIICNVNNQKFLAFIVKNPQDYINKVTSPHKRKVMEINYKMFGSPINISANILQENFDKLYNLLIEEMKKYKQ
ncbi:MAG: hypothetical protein LBR60_05310 [Fibrobacter sp.]|jgi:hypothetical protein|nr:hypothetical protein [Fibrobacter sp.]